MIGEFAWAGPIENNCWTEFEFLVEITFFKADKQISVSEAILPRSH